MSDTAVRRRLGNSDLMISPLGVGAWAMGGGGWQFGWGPQDDRASIAAIHAALAAGWNWIDTAAVYGLGHSEQIVAQALVGVSPKPYVFTKCQLCWDERGAISGRLKRTSVRKECEDSLRRLNLDVIDLYQIHWPEPNEDIEEGWDALVGLRQEGKVRYIGVSNFSVAQIKRIQPIGAVTSLQPPYSIISPEIEAEQLPFCQAYGIGVIAYSTMKSGLLTGAMTRARIAAMPDDDFRKRAAHFREPRLSRNLLLAESLREIGTRHGRTPGEIAIAWCLRHPTVTGAIVGLRSPEQVRGVVGAAEFRLSGEEIAEIARFMSENPV